MQFFLHSTILICIDSDKSHLPKKYEIEILEIKMRKKTKSNFFETKVSLEGRDECRPFIIILKKIYTTGFTLSCCNKND